MLTSLSGLWDSIFNPYRYCSSPHTVTSFENSLAYEETLQWVQVVILTALSLAYDTLMVLEVFMEKTVLCGDYDKLQWRNYHTGFSHCPILFLLSPFHRCWSFINIIHSKHCLKGWPRESKLQQKAEKSSFLCAHRENKMDLWTCNRV